MNMPDKHQNIDYTEDDADFEDDEIQEGIRQDATNAGDGEGVETNGRLLIVRQPKQSDADIIAAEVSTVRPCAVPCTECIHSTGLLLIQPALEVYGKSECIK